MASVDNSSFTFIVKKDTNILNFKGNEYTVTQKLLKKGTVFTGTLRTKIIGRGKDNKRPVKLLQVDGSKDYVELSSSNIYMDELAKADKSNFDGGENAPTTSKPYDKNYKTKAGLKNIVLKYGLPIGGAYVGYQIAKKKGLDTTKTFALVIALGFVSYLPYLAQKRKK